MIRLQPSIHECRGPLLGRYRKVRFWRRDSALEHAYKAVKLDPEHVDAWHVISDAHLMADGKPANLIDASKSPICCEKNC